MSTPGDWIKVTLSKHEWFMAAMDGVARRVATVDRPDKHGTNPLNRWQVDCDGACGEKVVSKWMNVYHSGNLNTYGLPDVAGHGVRTTALAKGSLIIRPDDADERPFILVLSHLAPVFYLCGWLYGYEAKQQSAWWTDGGNGRDPAWFAPQEALHPMNELPPTP